MRREPYIIRKIGSKAAFMLNLKRTPFFPREIWLEPTTRCNLRCITCEKYLKPPGEDRHMDVDVYERVKEQILPRIYRANLIGLGEPLVSPLFPQMIEDCINLGVRFSYTTNGMLLTRELVEKTMKYGYGITLSIDGVKKETFESIRRGARFDTIIEKIDMINEELQRLKPKNFEYCWNFVGMKRNIEELPELVKMAAEKGATMVTVLNFGTGGRDDEIARETLSQHPALANKFFSLARDIAHKHNLTLILPIYTTSGESTEVPADLKTPVPENRDQNTLPRALPEGRTFPVKHLKHCYSPWYQSYIRVDGDIWPCCMYSTYSLGNIMKQDFATIWNNELYRKLRETIHSGNPPYWCARCNVSWGITGGDELFFFRQMKF